MFDQYPKSDQADSPRWFLLKNYDIQLDSGPLNPDASDPLLGPGVVKGFLYPAPECIGHISPQLTRLKFKNWFVKYRVRRAGGPTGLFVVAESSEVFACVLLEEPSPSDTPSEQQPSIATLIDNMAKLYVNTCVASDSRRAAGEKIDMDAIRQATAIDKQYFATATFARIMKRLVLADGDIKKNKVK